MKHACTWLFAAIFCFSCSAQTGKPSKEDIVAVMKDVWEKAASTTAPKTTVTVNNIKMGTSEKSNYAQQLEGVPKGATVTHAKIDFTHHTFYTNETRNTRRIMTAWVYKNQFDEWSVMNVGTVYPDN